MINTIKTVTELKSEIEINQDLVNVGDIIFYTDMSNCMKYEVTENFGDGVEVKALNDDCNVEKGQFEDLFFNELQKGWEFSNETRNLKPQLDA